MASLPHSAPPNSSSQCLPAQRFFWKKYAKHGLFVLCVYFLRARTAERPASRNANPRQHGGGVTERGLTRSAGSVADSPPTLPPGRWMAFGALTLFSLFSLLEQMPLEPGQALLEPCESRIKGAKQTKVIGGKSPSFSKKFAASGVRLPVICFAAAAVAVAVARRGIGLSPVPRCSFSWI